MTYETFMVTYFQELTSWGMFVINMETFSWSNRELEVVCTWSAGRDPAGRATHGAKLTERVNYVTGPDPEGAVQNAMFRLMTLAVLQAKKARLNLRGVSDGTWDGLAGLGTWDTAKLTLQVQPHPPSPDFVLNMGSPRFHHDDRLDALSLALTKGRTR